MITRLKFKSNTTGGIRYCEFDDVNKTFTKDYYRYNGGHKPSQKARLKDVRAAVAECVAKGYREI